MNSTCNRFIHKYASAQTHAATTATVAGRNNHRGSANQQANICYLPVPNDIHKLCAFFSHSVSLPNENGNAQTRIEHGSSRDGATFTIRATTTESLQLIKNMRQKTHRRNKKQPLQIDSTLTTHAMMLVTRKETADTKIKIKSGLRNIKPLRVPSLSLSLPW